jgi:putative ABC transport system permease protein
VTGWLVTMRGIRYRAARSAVVFALAVAATTAAVLAPAYTRAAQESVLTDELRATPQGTLGLTIRSSATGVADLAGVTMPLVRHRPTLAAVTGTPYRQALARVMLSSVTGEPDSTVLYRSGACARLRVVAGRCPAGGGTGVMMEAATARQYGLSVGDPVALGADPSHRIVGLYRVRDINDPYWWGAAGYLTYEPPTPQRKERVPALIAGSPAAANWPGASDPAAELDVPVDPGAIDLTGVGSLRQEIASAAREASRSQADLRTGLPAVFDTAAGEERAVGTSVPVVAVPLVLLCWFVLYLMVASLTEDRGPEIALAKLRGFGTRGTVRFGLGEALVLIVAAAPVGLVVGLALVEVFARTMLAAGTDVEVRWPVLAVTALALAGAVVAAVLAARRTVRAPAMSLLRRVPERGRWRATVVEGAVVALAAAALYQVLSAPGSRLGLLAPPLLALVLGLVAAWLLTLAVRRRLRAARGRLRPARLLGYAQLARRPIARRIVLAVTVAVSLLGFAATAWDVAGHNRQRLADDEVGASRVYEVSAPGPQALTAAVHRIDPHGRYLMAAMETGVHYGDGAVSVLAVESDRLPTVAAWPGRSAGDVRALAARLAGPRVPPVTVRGTLRLTVRTDQEPTGEPMEMAALVARPDTTPRELLLGAVRPGSHEYAARLTGCDAGCELVGIGLARYPGDYTRETAAVTVTAARDGGGPLDIGLDRAGHWQYVPAGGSTATLRLSTVDGLGMRYAGTDPYDPIAMYATTPARLPVVLAGGAPADDTAADRFSFPAFGGDPVRFAVTARTDAIPRAGGHALLVDLADARQTLLQQSADINDSGVSYQVWAGPDAPAGLPDRLAAAGLTVHGVDTLADTDALLGREAPGLALRLYLIAGIAALLLAAGAVLLTAQVGASGRRYEMAALRVAGVPPAELRRAVRHEYRLLLGVPVLTGLVAGALGAVLMLPTMRLVTSTDAGLHRAYELGPWWVPGAVLATVLALGGAAAAVTRMLGGAAPERLRDGPG